MRTREPYVTLRRGREVLQQQEEEAWKERTARLRKWRRKFTHWIGIRLMRWGYQLTYSSTLDETPSLPV